MERQKQNPSAKVRLQQLLVYVITDTLAGLFSQGLYGLDHHRTSRLNNMPAVCATAQSPIFQVLPCSGLVISRIRNYDCVVDSASNCLYAILL